MTLKSFFIPLTVAAALAVSAVPASAQHGGGGGGHSGGGGHMSGGGGHVGGHSGSQHGGGSFHGGDHHGHDGHFRGRGGFGDHRFRDHRFGDRRFGGRRFGGPFVHARLIRPFGGPFFAFRPRFGLGFGLFVGYPVPYPWDYIALDPYGYDYPYDDPYDGGSNAVTDSSNGMTDSEPQAPNSAPSDEQRTFGGVSLDITPSDATVTVDGAAAGAVKTFSSSSVPLTLPPGQHHIVIEKPGYQPMTFDANVVQGQVIPYKGEMQRQ